jgi:hypothetical protein
MKAPQIAQHVNILPSSQHTAIASPVYIPPDDSSIRRPSSTNLTPTSLSKRGRPDLGSLHVTPPHQQPPVSGRSPFVMRSPTVGENIPEAPSTPRRPVHRVPIVRPTAAIVNAAGDGNCFYRFVNCKNLFIIQFI